MEYKVIESTEKEMLVEVINTHISDGWRPKGGISTCVTLQGAIVYFQALVKDQNK
jgi:hypothetical protein